MLDFLELEETVGRAWHRLVGATASYPVHPDEAATLADVQGQIAIMFRALGGEAGVQIAGAKSRKSGHRLGWRQRIGLGDESIDHPGRDGATVFLPDRIALFPDRELNALLYRWLAAWFATAPVATADEIDPLRRDLVTLRRARETVGKVQALFPGLVHPYAAAGCGHRASAPAQAVAAGRAGSRADRAGAARCRRASGRPALAGRDRRRRACRRRRRPDTGPCCLVRCGATAGYAQAVAADVGDDDAPVPGDEADVPDTRKRRAVRERDDGGKRDPFILNRFEKILAMAEMVNVDRPSDDNEDEDARKAADDLDELAIGRRSGKPATKLKFDLDLPPEAVDATPLDSGRLYPEWDYRSGVYLQDHCRVLTGQAPEIGETWTPDANIRRHVRQVRRRFEALRPQHEVMRGQADGFDLDLDALVRARCDLRAGSGSLDRVHIAMRPQAHDLAATLLVDVSLSTDAWVDGQRVLDVEKEALLVLAHGLSACGDHHSILTFTSRRRAWVRVETVKAFDEPMGVAVERRIGALKPGYYTRIGAAVRHAAAELAGQPQRKKLLLVLTDGKPNDVDHYEGRFAVEDTRKAVREARRLGVAVFGVTVDANAQSYFPTLFGRGGYAIVGNIRRLPAALPAIYRQLVR